MKYTNHIRQELTDAIEVNAIVNINLFEFPQNYYTESDKHPFWELVYVVNGKLIVKAENYSGSLSKGQLIFHRPNEMHSLSCATKDTTTIIILGFFCDTLLPLALSQSPTTASMLHSEQLANIVKEGREVFLPPYDVPTYQMKKRSKCVFGAEQMFKNMIECFLIDIIRKYTLLSDSNAPKDYFPIEDVIKYLDINYKEKILLDHLVFMFATNRSTLCQKFRAATNMSILNYIAQKKLENAILLLSEGKSITETAELLNFQSIHYFTRFFRKHTGLSPSAYKEQLNKNVLGNNVDNN